ncbi:MAG: DUF559 domain-containing protein [Acidimicrobiia bacterium]
MDKWITDIGARQHGVVSRAQARSGGLTRGAIQHRVDTGRWVAITPRLYRVAGAPMTDRAWVMATVLSAGADAVSTSSTALAQHQIRDFMMLPARVVVARRPHALALDGVTETFRLSESHRTVVDGIPTATVARALFDLGATVGARRLERSVDAALAARRVSIPELVALLDDLAERGRTGSARLRSIVQARLDGYECPTTVLESRFLELVGDYGLPRPECQVEIAGNRGWIGDVDFVWRERRVVVETDGGAYHDSITDRENDERRDRALEEAGWTVLRFNWIDVTTRPTSVLRTVQSALAIAG